VQAVWYSSSPMTSVPRHTECKSEMQSWKQWQGIPEQTGSQQITLQITVVCYAAPYRQHLCLWCATGQSRPHDQATKFGSRNMCSVKRPINSQLNWAILLCDVIPDGTLSKLRSIEERRPQNCPFQSSFT
jgi:hypothetical protein